MPANETKHPATCWWYLAGYTFRATRGTGVLVVHKGDFKRSHITAGAVANEPFGDWTDTEEVRAKAEEWLAVHHIRIAPRSARHGGR